MTASATLRVLHVDDEPTVLSTTVNYFDRFADDIEIETTTDPETALARLQRDEFDCLLCDYEMPGMDGLAVLERLQADGPDIPAILYTGRGSEDVASQAISRGADEYVRKDQGLDHYEELADTIRRAVQTHGLAAATDSDSTTAAQEPGGQAATQDETCTRARDRIAGLLSVDADRRIVEVDEQAASLLGQSQAALDGAPLAESVPAEHSEKLERNVQRALEEGEPVGFALSCDGRTVHVIAHPDADGVTVQFASGGVDDGGTAGTPRDRVDREITERKAREERLRETKQRLDIALEATDTGVWEWNTETDEAYWNDSTQRLFGLEPGTFEGTFEGFASRVHPDDLPAVKTALQQALEDGEQYGSEYRIERPDGELRWMYDRAKVVTDDDGTEWMVGTITDFTERKRKEQELRENQEKLRQISENVDDVVWMNTPEQDGITFVSAAYEDIWGRPVEELRESTMSFVEAIHPDDRDRVLDAMNQQQTDPDDYDETYRVVQPDGEIRWVHDRSAGVYDEDGDLERIVGIATDVTERKEREEELKRVRQRFERFAENVQDAFFLLAGDYSETLYVNPSVEALYGIAAGEVKDDPTAWLDHVHPDDEAQLRASVAEQQDGAIDWPIEQEFRVQHPERGLRWIRSRLDPIRDDEGTIVRVAGVATDITERKQREEELVESEARFRAVFENAHDAFLIADDDGEYTDANPAACDLLGVDYDDLLGKTVADFAPADFDFQAAWQEFLASDNQRGEFPLVRANGKRRVVEFSATTNVRSGQHMSALRDVTERKEREREIERQNERLELLASTISHDLRNPLRSAQSHLEMAQRECETDLLEEVAFAHERIDELIADLLTLARQGQAVTEPDPVDLADIATEAWEQIDAPAATLSAADGTVSADRTRLLQVFENLFSNAVEHGRTDATIRVGPTERGFFVADDGSGIPEDEREYVFEYGYTNTPTGTGFGLAIVEEIAEAHGWRVSVTDSEAGGARFEFETR